MNTPRAASCRASGLFDTLSWGVFWMLLVQLALALVLVVVLVLWPLTQQSAEARAGVLVLAVQTWLELPQGTRSDFVAELHARHGVTLELGCEKTQAAEMFAASFPAALQRALAARMSGMSAFVPQVSVGEDRQQLVACLELNGQMFSLRFAAPRLLNARLIALGLILLFSALLAGVLALFMARKLAQPVERMTQAVQHWGKSAYLPLPSAPKDVFELCVLRRALEEMHQRLRAHEQARTTLLAGISHDLRTPLARMRLAVEMLPADTDALLQRGMVDDVEAMDALIAQSLQLARSEGARGASLPQERVNLVQLAQKLVDDLQRGGMRLSLSVEAHALADCERELAPLALQRILLNLLDNAWRYSAQQAVELVLDCSGAAPRFCVLDRGPGIPLDKREDVFLAFTRLEDSRNRTSGGSGLGLAIARQWADAQGWQMGIEDRQGGGSCFWVQL